MSNNNFIVIIPAYNEESTIIDCLDHVVAASDSARSCNLEKIIVCLNGCTDKTEELVSKWVGAPIQIIHSRPGYINAMNQLLRYSKKNFPDRVMIKTDADCTVDEDSFSVLFKQLEQHQDLIVVGGHPIPSRPTTINPYRRFLSRLLSVRSRTPEAEVTVLDTARFHQYAHSDPIPELNGRETQLKIYFHGRLWCSRTPRAIPFLPVSVIGDDVYLPGWLIKNHGYRSMRLDYRAKVRFHPNDSIQRHWKVYRRIFEDRNIVYGIEGFKEYADNCPLKLDWPYIFKNTPANELTYFLLYAAFVYVEKVSYRFSTYDTTYWEYSKKEV